VHNYDIYLMIDTDTHVEHTDITLHWVTSIKL